MKFLVIFLIMVFAVLLAEIISHFLPKIATPIIQIGLGIAISFIPLAQHFHIPHEYFHILFIAPLAYFGGMEINRRQLWKMRWSILNMAVILVIVSGIIIAPILHGILPALSVTASLLLMASLGPTDHIAVEKVEKHSNVPERLMGLLKSESVFAEVTSIVLFQTFIGAMIGKNIHADAAIGKFFYLALGGAAVGISLAIIKLLIIRFLTVNSINSEALHTLIGVAFPIFAYIIAEHFHVSGVLAIFLAGIISTYEYKKGTAATIRLDHGAKSVWEFLSFTLDGIIFVTLGMQVPHIVHLLYEGHLGISTPLVFGLIFLISGLLFAIRFFFALATLPKSIYEKDNIRRSKASLLFSMSGARGAITWAAISSIPAVLANGFHFPYHELITVVSMGVIIVSITVSYIVLPLVAPMKAKHNDEEYDKVYIDILNNVIRKLQTESTADNRNETSVVVYRYRDRIDDLHMSMKKDNDTNSELDALLRRVSSWSSENVKRLYSENKISETTYNYYVKHYGQNVNESVGRSALASSIKAFFNNMKMKNKAKNVKKDIFLYVAKSNTEYVISKLMELYKLEPSYAIDQMLDKYKFRLNGLINAGSKEELDKEKLVFVEERALEIEREFIQIAYENGNLTHEKAKHMKQNLIFLSLDLHDKEEEDE